MPSARDPPEVVEPHVAAHDHVQMAVPRVLARVLGKGVAGLAVAVPRVGDEGAATLFGLRMGRGVGEGAKDAPGKGKRRERHVSEEGVFSQQRRCRQGEGDGRLRVRGGVGAGRPLSAGGTRNGKRARG